MWARKVQDAEPRIAMLRGSLRPFSTVVAGLGGVTACHPGAGGDTSKAEASVCRHAVPLAVTSLAQSALP